MKQQDIAAILTLLNKGEIEPEGRIAWGSNYTMLARICHEGREEMMVYKPQRGERPLWDFAAGTLCQRERAAWLVSQQIGWQIVPPTVLREGVHGIGSMQFFIDHDPNVHYFDIQGDTEHTTALQQITLFDLITNNADRKAGHVLVGTDNHLWAIDHGICFHTEYKLRSVIWDFAGSTIPTKLLDELRAFEYKLEHLSSDSELQNLLSSQEVAALQNRTQQVINLGIFPEPGAGRHYPWPPI